MTRPELYQKSVDILVDAYFKDTLQHSYCACCAVGNLICGNLNGEVLSEYVPVYKVGEKAVGVPWLGYLGSSHFGLPYVLGDVNEITGYSNEELRQIEYAFEGAPEGNSDDEWMVNGLYAVIDVLDQIHNNTDHALTTTTKERFVKHG